MRYFNYPARIFGQKGEWVEIGGSEGILAEIGIPKKFHTESNNIFFQNSILYHRKTPFTPPPKSRNFTPPEIFSILAIRKFSFIFCK